MKPSSACRFDIPVEPGQFRLIKRVEGNVLILGEETKLTPWQRFVRLQRRARLLSRGKGFRPGVYRLKTDEELREWTLKNRQI